ncbi:MAG TPA: alkaline phosphatase family protein [Candidatus Acidoferrales bacterium]|nr:alkaline phosphatase family protein [Candidatus Acidoferrales bacterium]
MVLQFTTLRVEMMKQYGTGAIPQQPECGLRGKQLGGYSHDIRCSSQWEFPNVATNEPPIKHVIILYEENHAFDNYFGTYPGANGLNASIALPVKQGSNATVSPFHQSS